MNVEIPTKSVICSLGNSLNELCTPGDVPGVTVRLSIALRLLLRCFTEQYLG